METRQPLSHSAPSWWNSYFEWGLDSATHIALEGAHLRESERERNREGGRECVCMSEDEKENEVEQDSESVLM